MNASAAPRRIQRKRTKGWRMPPGAVYIGRPTWLGNPFTIGRVIDRVAFSSGGETIVRDLVVRDHLHAAQLYRMWLNGTPTFVDEIDPPTEREIQFDLRGRDVCCWCALDAPCHGDVLLEIANGGDA